MWALFSQGVRRYGFRKKGLSSDRTGMPCPDSTCRREGLSVGRPFRIPCSQPGGTRELPALRRVSAAATSSAVTPEKTVVGSSQSESPGSQEVKHSSPGLADEAMGVLFHGSVATDDGSAADVGEEVSRLRNGIQKSKNMADLRALLHSPTLFSDLGSVDQVKQTVLKWLADIGADTRDHRTLGADPTFSIHDLIPAPVREAVWLLRGRVGIPRHCCRESSAT